MSVLVDTVDGRSEYFHGDDVEFIDTAGTTRFARIVGIFEDNTVWHKSTNKRTNDDEQTNAVVAAIGILYSI